MKRKLSLASVAGLIAVLMLSLQACSSGGKSSSDEGDLELPPEGEVASTDAVPLDTAELPAESLEEPLSDVAALDSLDPAPAADAPSIADVPPQAPMAEPLAAAPPVSEPVAEVPAPPVAEVAPAVSGETSTYSVRSSDTLMKIAFETYGDIYQWRKIYEMNRDKIQDPNRIPVGTQLTLEKPVSQPDLAREGERYAIKQGETLGTIAQDIYGTKKKWKRLYEQNKTLIKDPNRIFAGFQLYYTMTPEERAEAERLKQSQPETQEAPPLAQTPAASAPAPARAPASAAPAPASVGPMPVGGNQ